MEAPAQVMQPYVAFEAEGSFVDMMLEQVEFLLLQMDDEGYQLSTEEGKAYLIDAAIEWDGGVRNNKRMELYIKRYFWPEIHRLTGVDTDYVFAAVEEYIEKKRKKEYQRLIEGGMADAQEFMRTGCYDAATQSLSKAMERAEAAITERPARPIRNFSDTLPGLRKSLMKTQGIKFTGYTQNVIPELDDATDGFQGLTLITAKSGEGKTAFVIQNVAEILSTRPDVCCLIVSMDMLENKLGKRFLTNRAKIPIRAVERGTGEKGWTPEERYAVTKGFEDLERFGKRLRIADRFVMPYTTRQNIQREMNQLMEDSDCNQCILVLDYLELMYCPDDVKEQDEWIIEQVRAIADNGHTIFCIAESRKNGDVRGSADNVKGSYRKVMRSDVVITLNSLMDDELVDWWDITDEGYLSFRASKTPWEGKPMEKVKRAARIRKAQQKRGEQPVMLKIDKARDGAMKTEMYVMNYFQRCFFLPLDRGQ